MSKVDAPLDEVALKKEGKKTDKKVKKDKKDKKVKEAKQIDAGLQLFKGKDSELDGIFGKGSEYALPKTAPVLRAAVASSSKVAEGEKERSTKRQKKASKVLDDSSDEEQEQQPATPAAGPSKSVEENEEDNDAELSEGSEIDTDEELVHETTDKTSKRKRKLATKLPTYTPADETSQDRDRRSIFVGNLPIEVTKSKSAQNQLKSHLLTHAPSAKIESIRFRSIPFATPTDAVPEQLDADSKEKNMNREKRRAAAWRAEQDKLESGDKHEIEAADKAKTFIDAKGKRKVAFIKKDFHSEMDACNAYVIFAHPHPDRPTNVAPVMNPFEAATAVLAANGSTFMSRTIRIDKLRLPSAIALETAINALSKRDAWLPSNADPKKSLFVGGLDYAAKEEDVRVLFEELVKSERGSSAEKYVTGVRIVRDAATQLGKGFGYVHFKDRESVEELLAMDEKKFRFAKRPLRVQPCKTLPLGARTTPAQAAAQKTRTVPKGPVPKGNPKLGDAIKDLSKEERKMYKSTDADRQARRMAKKKAKVAFDQDRNTGAVKLDTGRSKDKHVKPKAKKSKARSAHAVSQMKGSRA